MKNTLTFKPQAPDMDEQISELSAKLDLLEKNQVEIQENISRMTTEVNEFFRALVSFVDMKNRICDKDPSDKTIVKADVATHMSTDPLVRSYGEVCFQSTAAKIIGVSARTIKRMLEDGRLRASGNRAAVRSISEFLHSLPNLTHYIHLPKLMQHPYFSTCVYFGN